MILKGNARDGADNLARHLTNSRENDRVEIAELRGVAATDLHGALKDMEAVASGTRCERHLYSLSINPSQSMSREQYATAIDRIEEKLGLEGHARAVVFHWKHSKTQGDSREHCHVVWSRIDENTMTAAQLSFDRQKLRSVARDLALELGHAIPKNLAEDRGPDRFADRFNGQSYQEQGQQKRTGLDPAARKAEITAAWHAADSGAAFIHALEERGYYLARGDRRSFVVVDRAGEVHALRRQIEGAKAAEVTAKLAPLSADKLPSVDQAKAFIAQRQRAQSERDQAYAGVTESHDAHLKRHRDLLDTQAAELKALQAKFAQLRQQAQQQESDAIERAKAQVKADFKPQWRDLFKRQKAEIRAFDKAQGNVIGRLRYYLATPEMRLPAHDEGRGHLAAAFNWIVRGKTSRAPLATTQEKERQVLGRQQFRASRAAEKEIQGENKEYFKTLSADRGSAIDTMKAQHRLQRVASERVVAQAYEKTQEKKRADQARQGDARTSKMQGDDRTSRTQRDDWLRASVPADQLAKAAEAAKRQRERSKAQDRDRPRGPYDGGRSR